VTDRTNGTSTACSAQNQTCTFVGADHLAHKQLVSTIVSASRRRMAIVRASSRFSYVGRRVGEPALLYDFFADLPVRLL
jgi:hypothetical protein